MKFKNFILYLIIFVYCILNVGLDFNEYKKLEKMNDEVIKKGDLPVDFGDDAYRIVVDFIQKTKDLNYEWAIFFDYVSGEILKCGKGDSDNVKLEYDADEFAGKRIASIHNHPKNAFSPPSGKNFNIFSRIFEDYELIVGRDGLWILESKGIHENLIDDLRKASLVYYIFTLSQCGDFEKNREDVNGCEDALYGGMLSNYINDKNINGIQLTKREYSFMANNSKTEMAEFEHFESISNPEDLILLHDFIENPNLEENKERITDFFAKMNVEMNVDELIRAMQDRQHSFLFKNKEV